MVNGFNMDVIFLLRFSRYKSQFNIKEHFIFIFNQEAH